MKCKTPNEVLLADALIALMTAQPLTSRCSDFHHVKKDRHEHNEDCPCLKRWEGAQVRAFRVLSQKS
jgi:hypothetical protein